MNRPSLLKYAVIPALAIIPGVAWRASWETSRPESPWLPFITILPFAIGWLLYFTVRFLRDGVSFPRYLGVLTVYTLLYRGVVAVPYALSWTQRWTTPTGEPSRYTRQIAGFDADASFLRVWSAVTAFPSVFHLLIASLIWFLLDVLYFRRRRAVAL